MNYYLTVICTLGNEAVPSLLDSIKKNEINTTFRKQYPGPPNQRIYSKWVNLGLKKLQ